MTAGYVVKGAANRSPSVGKYVSSSEEKGALVWGQQSLPTRYYVIIYTFCTVVATRERSVNGSRRPSTRFTLFYGVTTFRGLELFKHHSLPSLKAIKHWNA